MAPPTRLLTDKGVEELAFLEEGCVEDVLEYYAGIPSEELFRLEDWDLTLADGSDPNVLNAVGNETGVAPMPLVHGTLDTSVPGGFVASYVELACKMGQTVQLEWYEGPHRVFYDPATGAADSVLAWIDARVAGEPVPSVCDDIPPMPTAEA